MGKNSIFLMDFDPLSDGENEHSRSEMNLNHRGSLPLSATITKLNDYILYYLSGYIVKKLSNIDCYSCAENLRAPKNDHNYNKKSDTFTRFLDFSNRGGLMKPSNSVFKLCIEAEKELDIATDGFTELFLKNLDLRVITKVKNKFTLDQTIFPNLNCENVYLTDMPHKIRLIVAIVSRYINIRLYSYSQFYLHEILKPIRKRHQFTKTILFSEE